jgi:ATP-dependent Clp protease protease subunit
MNKITMSLAQYLLENRIIFLSGDIDTKVAEHVITSMLVLDSLDKRTDIKLYISSYGGSVYAGLAIYDCMQMIEAPISTFCIGPAFSMAAWLLAAGEKGKRYATPNSKIMLHQAWAQTAGTTSDIKVAAENIIGLEKKMIEILSRHTGKTNRQLNRSIQRDFWMNPQEAINFGVIDHIGSSKIEKGKIL